MTNHVDQFLAEHQALTRRFFLGLGATGISAANGLSIFADDRASIEQEAIEKLESWLTRPNDFRDVSRGKPIPHTLPEETKSEVGLTRDTWQLEVTSDKDKPARIRTPLTKKDGNAIDFKALLQLGEKHSVRFAKVMTCLNIGCPLGNGIWEGVALREVLWLTQPRENLRRVFFWGYHNEKPEQMFRSSLPVGRILEDTFDLPPVILCYKLNGQWLTPERGGPVRVVVPEGYGFKSIKWLTNVVLSNIYHANDTYEKGNNDLDSPLKSFAATLSYPKEVKAEQPFAITGYAQVGISGLSTVQVWIHKDGDDLPSGGRYFSTAPWRDAEILPVPPKWGGGIPDDRIPADTLGFDENGRPKTWPMRLAKAHWVTVVPGLAPGKYTLRSRTIDEKGHAQPMPRPFRKSGHAAIEQVSIEVKA